MIHDIINNVMKYSGISENMKTACKLIAETDFDSLEPGRYDIDGTNVYCVIQKPDLKEKSEIKWEAHKNYADIQVGIEDGEGAEYLPLESISNWEEYNPNWDMIYAAEKPDGLFIEMKKNTFTVFFPWDAHRPCISCGSAKGHKAVIKVKID